MLDLPHDVRIPVELHNGLLHHFDELIRFKFDLLLCTVDRGKEVVKFVLGSFLEKAGVQILGVHFLGKELRAAFGVDLNHRPLSDLLHLDFLLLENQFDLLLDSLVHCRVAGHNIQ